MISIAILGAGCIGCHLAGELLHHANPDEFSITLIGRKALKQDIQEYGLTVTDYTDLSHHLPADMVNVSTAPDDLAGSDIIFVCVKCPQTEEAAKLIQKYNPDAIVISMQNGVRNPERLRAVLTQARVVAGMVPYNVVSLSEARFHKATEGQLYLEDNQALSPPKLASFTKLLEKAFQPHWFPDLSAVQYSKLLLNLNNLINALSNLPLKLELETRSYRLQLAQCVREGLAVYKAAGIETVNIGKVPLKWLPTLLSTPDFLFSRLANSMLKIDPEARSSMWHDLQRQRLTEIDELNGEIVRLGQKHGVPTPENNAVYNAIKQREESFA